MGRWFFRVPLLGGVGVGFPGNKTKAYESIMKLFLPTPNPSQEGISLESPSGRGGFKPFRRREFTV